MTNSAAAEHAEWGGMAQVHKQRQENGDAVVMIMGKDGKSTSERDQFARIRARLKAAVGEDVFNSWFARLELEEIVDDLAHLSVPTRFLCSWIQSNYAEKILEAFKAEIGQPSPGCTSPCASTARPGRACSAAGRAGRANP